MAGPLHGDATSSVLKIVAGHLLSGAVGASTTYAEDRITGQRIGYGQIAVDAGISAMSFGLTIHPNVISNVREYSNLVAEDEFPSSIASARIANNGLVSLGFGVAGAMSDYFISRYVR